MEGQSMGHLLRGVLALVALVLVSSGASATALTFFWHYSGAGVSANGAIQADMVTGADWHVTGMGGQRNGVPVIASLVDYADGGDFIYKKQHRLDALGLSFVDLNGEAFKVYYDFSTPFDPYACGPLGSAGYCELGPGAVGTNGFDDPRREISFFAWWEDLPEPPGWTVMLAAALLGLVFARRGSTKAVAVAHSR
jgi:hypothetical protein